MICVWNFNFYASLLFSEFLIFTKCL
jgi:hypothetical protein